MPLARAALLALGALAATSACVAEPLVDAFSYDEGRSHAGMTLLGGDERFAFYARPGEAGDTDPRREAALLGRVREHFAHQLGREVALPPIRIYIHPPGSFDDELITYDGLASCADQTVDVVLGPHDGTLRRSTLAHELAHLVICATVGGSQRAALTEGLAEYLENTYDEPGYPADGPPAGRDAAFVPRRSPALFFGEMMCEEGWRLSELLPNARWFGTIDARSYAIAALLTQLAVDRLGMPRYLARIYQPAGRGTSRDVERLFVDELGLDLPGLERAMRQAAHGVSELTCDAARGLGCPGACRCVPFARLTAPRLANDLCVPPGIDP